MDFRDVHAKKDARVYLICKAFEVASELNVPEKGFNERRYLAQKCIYEGTAKNLREEYGIDTTDCDRAIEELEKICLKEENFAEQQQ